VLLRGVAALVGAAALVRLAAWQWERGRESGRLLHYTYAVEWLLVSVLLVVLLLVRSRHRERDSETERSQGSRGVAGTVIGPPLQPGERLPPTVRDRVLGRLRQWTGQRR
jgi:uncharacterized membrane protein